MKILFCSRSQAHFPYHVSIIEALLQKGHQVRLLYDEIWSDRSLFENSALIAFAGQQPSLSLGWSQRRAGGLRPLIFYFRELRTVASYLSRPAQSRFYVKRWIRYLPENMRRFVRSRFGRRFLTTGLARTLFAEIESLIPPWQPIKRELAEYAPDVVVCSPANLRWSEELEYLKAAKILSIPTALPVYSWDNLSTKGLIHVAPDLVLAWNKVHEEEAVMIHEISPDRVVQTGAPFFDKWFSLRSQSEGRLQFLKKINLDPMRPYLLYLGSSANIARDESWVVAKMADDFRGDSILHDMQILIRPHPANNDVYEKVLREGIAIWPRKRQLPDDPDSQIDFVSSVQHAVLSIGINTSGMIDALIQDRPVAAFMSDTFKATQEEATHFRHMRDAGCLYEVSSVSELSNLVKRLRGGEPEALCERRRAFVRAMVRPYGFDKNAGELSAWCIERLVENWKPEAIKASIGGACYDRTAANLVSMAENVSPGLLIREDTMSSPQGVSQSPTGAYLLEEPSHQMKGRITPNNAT